MIAVGAVLAVARPWDGGARVAITPTPVAVASEPAPIPSETPVASPIESVAAASPSPAEAEPPTPTPAPTKVAVRVRKTPKAKPVVATGKQPAAKFGARPSPKPNDPRFLALDEGHRLLDERRTSAAVAQYREVTRAHARFPDGHYWFAYASAMEGDATGACSGFKRYLALASRGYYAKSARQQVPMFCATID